MLLLLIGLTYLANISPVGTEMELAPLFERFLPALPATSADDPFGTVERLLIRITLNRGTLSLYAVPLFLWFSTRLFAGIRISLNEIFDTSLRAPRRHFLVSLLVAKLRDIGMVLLTVTLFTANTALLGVLSVLQVRLGFLSRFLAIALAFAFALTLFFLVYKHASQRRLPWRAALVAAVFTALAFEIAKRLFGLYVQYLASLDRMSAGANVGAVILFILWVYYTAIVFLFGGVVGETWDLRVRQQEQRASLE